MDQPPERRYLVVHDDEADVITARSAYEALAVDLIDRGRAQAADGLLVRHHAEVDRWTLTGNDRALDGPVYQGDPDNPTAWCALYAPDIAASVADRQSFHRWIDSHPEGIPA